MDRQLPPNVIDFNLAKQQRQEQQELVEEHMVLIQVSGLLCYDDLDNLMEDLHDMDLEAEAFIVKVKDVEEEESPPKAAND
jgi:hypothetical protein